MYDSLLHLVPFLMILLMAYATPKERGWDKPAAIVLCAVNVAATLPWVFAEMTGSNAMWPKYVSAVVMGVTMISALLLLLLRRRKKKGASDEDAAQSP